MDKKIDEKIIVGLILFGFLGLLFIVNGITGLVVSQSCCFPPDCTQENICDAARPQFESPANQDSIIFLGITLSLGSIIGYKILYKN